MPTFRIPMTTMCAVQGWIEVEADDEEHAVELAPTQARQEGLDEEDIEMDLDNADDWRFTGDWSQIERLTDEPEPLTWQQVVKLVEDLTHGQRCELFTGLENTFCDSCGHHLLDQKCPYCDD